MCIRVLRRRRRHPWPWSDIAGDLAKVAFTQDRAARVALLAALEDKLAAVSIAKAGKTATLYKPLPKRLS